MDKPLKKMNKEELIQYGQEMEPQVLFEEDTTVKEMRKALVVKPVEHPATGKVHELIEMTEPLNASQNYMTRKETTFRENLNTGLREILSLLENGE